KCHRRQDSEPEQLRGDRRGRVERLRFHPSPMKIHPSHSHGFSLIEVTMALGIAVFAIITLFALLPTGLNLSRESSAEGLAVNILSGLASDIRNSDGAATTVVYGIPL